MDLPWAQWVAINGICRLIICNREREGPEGEGEGEGPESEGEGPEGEGVSLTLPRA
jgi:hypothetical protein